MSYTAQMGRERFTSLARELAGRDPELPGQLAEAARHAERMRAHAAACVDAFRAEARAAGAQHLTALAVGPVEPDDKHVDCLQFAIERGRWRVLCVAKAKGKYTFVGPFQRGGRETPCRHVAFAAPDALEALEQLIVELLRRASETRGGPGVS